MKIGIFFDHPKNYKGGFNYIVNLINCLTFQNNKITIILFCDSYHFYEFKKKFNNKNVKIIKLSILNKNNLLFYLNKFLEKFFNSFLLFDYIINKYKIEIVSHSHYYGKKPFISWLPDFQFLHLPENFPGKQEKYINNTKKIFSKSKKIILSSYDCKNDLKKIVLDDAEVDKKTSIYRFPVTLNIKNDNDINEVRSFLKKNNILEYKYYFVANQFWEHKNYEFLFKVFKNLNLTIKKKFILVSTGSIIDNRNIKISYIENFKNEIDNGLIKILGQIDYKFVQGLIYFAKAYINPSKFEGWNTGVEEAKMMKKHLILSDLGIHREQCEKYNTVNFFNPKEPGELNQIIKKIDSEDNKKINLSEVILDNDLHFKNISLNLQRNYLSIKDQKLKK